MTRSPIILLFIGLALNGTGCFAEMDPGKSCGSCHNGQKAPRFGAAGTIYSSPTANAGEGRAGVTIDITDSTGKSVSLQSNDVGNFYTKAGLTPPLHVTVTRGDATRSMADAPSGDCNSCHTTPAASAPGRVYLP
jgi:hypothetical protein